MGANGRFVYVAITAEGPDCILRVKDNERDPAQHGTWIPLGNLV